jgi:hypothetical protein
MTPLSTRYVVPLFALLVPALLAVWVYSFGGFRSDDCADPSALSETTWIEGLERAKQPYGRPWRGLFQDIGGTVATEGPDISSLEFRILRSFESERLYTNPVKYLSRPGDFVMSQPMLKWIAWRGGELPIYEMVAEARGMSRIGAYVFLYDSRPVVNPALAMLSGALQRIATGRRPLTLVTVSVGSVAASRDAAKELAEKWLVSAWEYYRTVCQP